MPGHNKLILGLFTVKTIFYFEKSVGICILMHLFSITQVK